MRDGAGIDLIMDELRDILQGLIALRSSQRPSSFSHLIKLGGNSRPRRDFHRRDGR